jgi:SAM-dependent methyltransferase
MGAADERWAEQLAAWAIPDEILSQATADPWKLRPSVFGAGTPADGPPPDTPSARLALEALEVLVAAPGLRGPNAVAGLRGPNAVAGLRGPNAVAGGSVLDVGVGAGGASLHLAPPAALLIGVDEDTDMLDAFSARAVERGVATETIHGRWPDVAAAVPVADVVMCHHVFYNVPDLRPFALALTDHARRRVVVEIGAKHPVSGTNPLWKHFWGLDRPQGPTAGDALAVLAEAGIEARSERDVRPAWRSEASPERVEFLTRRLCLPPERAPEVEEALARLPEPAEREVVTIWWEGRARE